MSIRKQANVDRRDRAAGNGRGRRILAATGLAVAIAVVAAFALTGNPEPAQACLFPGIPC